MTDTSPKDFKIDVGYLTGGFEYFQGRFAWELDQVRPKVDQDRTRRALSNALFTFSKRPPLTGEKPKILLK